jgi:hypothetical protein
MIIVVRLIRDREVEGKKERWRGRMEGEHTARG